MEARAARTVDMLFLQWTDAGRMPDILDPSRPTPIIPGSHSTTEEQDDIPKAEGKPPQPAEGTRAKHSNGEPRRTGDVGARCRLPNSELRTLEIR